jgi:hypothetical protein
MYVVSIVGGIYYRCMLVVPNSDNRIPFNIKEHTDHAKVISSNYNAGIVRYSIED